MTRKSKREVEREIEQLQAGRDDDINCSDIGGVFAPDNGDDTESTDADITEDSDLGIGGAFAPDD